MGYHEHDSNMPIYRHCAKSETSLVSMLQAHTIMFEVNHIHFLNSWRMCPTWLFLARESIILQSCWTFRDFTVGSFGDYHTINGMKLNQRTYWGCHHTHHQQQQNVRPFILQSGSCREMWRTLPARFLLLRSSRCFCASLPTCISCHCLPPSTWMMLQ